VTPCEPPVTNKRASASFGLSEDKLSFPTADDDPAIRDNAAKADQAAAVILVFSIFRSPLRVKKHHEHLLRRDDPFHAFQPLKPGAFFDMPKNWGKQMLLHEPKPY
jgi:hypothetical protein